jgi:threonine synthase
MDSSVSPTHGEQENSVWNGHYACTCYHPLFVFNQFGDLERCVLRPGNVHSADGWEAVLKPVVARYQGKVSRICFRADAGFAGKPYADVAEAIIAPFVADEIEAGALRGMIAAAYRNFRHPAVAPLTQLDSNLFVLELFHGPTLAFKDLAMQLLAKFIDHVLNARGERATIIGATSGDTGAAAIEALLDAQNHALAVDIRDF